jgi:hydroxypyruvate reductase 2
MVMCEHGISIQMSGKHLGIVGLGRIGLAVAKRAEAFGCKISYLARAEKSELSYKFHATVLELAKNTDMLVLTCALTKGTTNLVGQEALDALGPEV